MKDYFAEAILLFPSEDGRYSAEDIFKEDIEKYRKCMIERYDDCIEEMATDGFNFLKFLDAYKVAVNVFGLHSNITSKDSLNKCIDVCWKNIVDNSNKR